MELEIDRLKLTSTGNNDVQILLHFLIKKMIDFQLEYGNAQQFLRIQQEDRDGRGRFWQI